MKTIDFLPERYRQAKKRRHTSYWRLVVTLMFIGVFAASAGGLYFKQRDVRIHSQHTSMLFAASQTQSALLTKKQTELARLNVYASLVTHLRHPWPRSRLLHELVTTLPTEVTIDQLHIHSIPREQLSTAKTQAAGESAEPTTRTVETDLAELQRRADEEQVVVDLEGTTRDQTALHIYLQSLSSSKLFSGAELTSVEAAVGEQSGRGDHFVAVVKVRPAWGIAGGPQSDGLLDTKRAEQVANASSARAALSKEFPSALSAEGSAQR